MAKSVQIPLLLTAAASAADTRIYKTFSGTGTCGCMSSESEDTSVVIWNEKMQTLVKVGRSFENSWVLLKEVIKTIENETKEQRSVFLSMLLDTFGASLLGHLLSGKGVIRAADGLIRAGNGMKKERIFNAASFFD